MLAGIENEELELIFQQLDSNKDDKISKDEFINYLISKDDDSE
jgi:Ca2+-binding EF-hand superfamily protein